MQIVRENVARSPRAALRIATLFRWLSARLRFRTLRADWSLADLVEMIDQDVDHPISEGPHLFARERKARRGFEILFGHVLTIATRQVVGQQTRMGDVIRPR